MAIHSLFEKKHENIPAHKALGLPSS
jgi:hypothetical protein